jgi:hypothetical protein
VSEEGEAKRDGAKLQSNSGRGHVQKGDATLDEFCIDYKEYRDGFRVSRRNWAKCVTDAAAMRKWPLMKLVLRDNEDSHRLRLFVIEERHFNELLEAWRQVNE